MPGLRLGYALCGDTELLDRMRLCGPDWAVSNIAQDAGIAALKNGREYIEKSCEYLKKERIYVMNELEYAKFTVYPSYANFIFFHCPCDVGLYGELRKKGIIIRDCSNFKGLEQGYYRTAVLTAEKNKLLAEAILDCVQSKVVKTLWQNQ